MELNNNRILELLKGKKALVIGDIMLDKYISGKSNRMSPEANVPVITDTKTYEMPGGAANVAINLKELDCEVTLVGAIGADRDGEQLSRLCKHQGIEARFVTNEASCTTVKCRIIANQIQVARIDTEQINYLHGSEAERLKDLYDELIAENDYELVVMQDYNKGVLSRDIIDHLISVNLKNNLFTAVDPKSENFFNYKKVQLFKPNLNELQNAVQRKIPLTSDGLKEAVREMRDQLQCETAMLTLSEHGICTMREEEFCWSRPSPIQVVDVSGAGDTVISVAALSLLNGGSVQEASQLANFAAAEVCQKPGVVSSSIKSRVRSEFHS